MVNHNTVERVTATEHHLLTRDLAILEAMTAGMDHYLASDAILWDMGRGHMPLLTIGGCLMRLRRLSVLQGQLDSDERAVLAHAERDFNAALKETVVRFEQRAYTELNARLREWTTYMRDLAHSTKISADQGRFASKTETRIVISELVSKLGEVPYQLDGRVPRDVAALDRRLRQMWKPGPFVLSNIWEKAYPIDPYWWLYGHPKTS